MLHELAFHPSIPTGQQPFSAHAILWWTKLRIWSKLKLIWKKKDCFTSDLFLDLVQRAAEQTFLLAQGRKQSRVRIRSQVEKEIRTAPWGTSASWQCTWNCSLRCFIFTFLHQKQVFIFCFLLILMFPEKRLQYERLLRNALKILARFSVFLKWTARFINENEGRVSIYNRDSIKKKKKKVRPVWK